MGYVGWIGTFEGKKGTGKEKVVESEMVGMLRKAGAILYCKTSVPHTLMSGETVNNIIGYTLNPKNRNLTAGGSSGGEGALIGIRGCKSSTIHNAMHHSWHRPLIAADHAQLLSASVQI